MQRDEGVWNLAQDLLGEVKAGCRRGQRARRPRKNGLVTRVILFVTFAPDVGRQRHRATRIKIDIFIQRYNPLAIRQDFFDAQNCVADLCASAEAHFSAGFDQTFPASWANTIDKQEFNRAVVGKSSRGEDPRIVQNEEIPRAEETFSIRRIVDVRLFVRRDEAPSSGNLRGVSSGR